MRRRVTANAEVTAELELDFWVEGDMPAEMDGQFLQMAAQVAAEKLWDDPFGYIPDPSYSIFNVKVRKREGEPTAQVFPGQGALEVTPEPGFLERWKNLKRKLNIEWAE